MQIDHENFGYIVLTVCIASTVLGTAAIALFSNQDAPEATLCLVPFGALLTLPLVNPYFEFVSPSSFLIDGKYSLVWYAAGLFSLLLATFIFPPFSIQRINRSDALGLTALLVRCILTGSLTGILLLMLIIGWMAAQFRTEAWTLTQNHIDQIAQPLINKLDDYACTEFHEPTPKIILTPKVVVVNISSSREIDYQYWKDDLVRDYLLGLSDGPGALKFIVLVFAWEQQVGTYQIGRGTAMRQFVDVRVYDARTRKCVGMDRIYGGLPPQSIGRGPGQTSVTKPQYGSLIFPGHVSHWISEHVLDSKTSGKFSELIGKPISKPEK